MRISGTNSRSDKPEDESAMSGILEIFHAGAWGSLCTRKFRPGEAGDGLFNSDSHSRQGPSLPGTEVRNSFDVILREGGTL